jgi:hypothetical protein
VLFRWEDGYFSWRYDDEPPTPELYDGTLAALDARSIRPLEDR